MSELHVQCEHGPKNVPCAPECFSGGQIPYSEAKFKEFWRENQNNPFLLISFQIYRKCGIWIIWNRRAKRLTRGCTSLVFTIKYKEKTNKEWRKTGGKKKQTNINRLNLQPFTTPPSKLLQMQKRPKVHNCFGGFQGKESVVWWEF